MGKGTAVAGPVSARSTHVSTQSTPVRGQSTLPPIVVAARPAMRKERAEGFEPTIASAYRRTEGAPAYGTAGVLRGTPPRMLQGCSAGTPGVVRGYSSYP